MSALWVVVLVLVAAVIGVTIYLVWPGSGYGLEWKSAPGGSLKFRLRLNSLVPRLLGSDATSLFGVILVGKGHISGYLLAHELAHIIRGGKGFGYPWKFLTNDAFHDAEEVAAIEFGKQYASDPWLWRRAETMRTD